MLHLFSFLFVFVARPLCDLCHFNLHFFLLLFFFFLKLLDIHFIYALLRGCCNFIMHLSMFNDRKDCLLQLCDAIE